MRSSKQDARAGLAVTMVLGGLLAVSPAQAGVVADGLVAFLDFAQGSGTVCSDRTGNGHDGTLTDGASWCATPGCALTSGGASRIPVISGEALRSATFTYDLWLETTGSSGDGRPLNQSGAVGGTGPEILERYRSGSYRYAFRINRNGNCIFDEPVVGTRSNDQVTDHWGICADPIRFNEGPEHLVFLHDATHKRVQVFTGLEDGPLRICFDATYQGSYAVTSQPLVLGNIPSGERGYRARYFQFAYYGRLLGVSVDPSTREVTGGEVLVNHQAGSDASIGSELPDAGLEDGAPPDDAATDPDASDVGDGSLGGGGSSGAGGHGGLAPPEGQPDGMTDASCGCSVPASRSSVGVWWLGLLAALLGWRLGRSRDRQG